MATHTCGLSSKMLSVAPGDWMARTRKARKPRGWSRRIDIVMKKDRSAVSLGKERGELALVSQ